MNKAWKVFWACVFVSLLFILVIGIIGERLNSTYLLPDTGASWYYWKLPVREFLPMLIVWVIYILHQLSVWILIYLAQFRHKTKRLKLRNLLILVNGVFIALHILQSHLWYDGLAQDVPVMSSQGSVIVMLVLILIMDNQRRGLFFGKKLKGFELTKHFILKYHGYFIAWALVYTFWYHPTIATAGHLVGFFYMFMLFIQMSFIYSPIHMNKYWRFALEVGVLFHGTMVAINQQNGMWPMFMFGFAFMAVCTQIYGIGLKKIHIIGIQIIYIIGVIIVFGGFTGDREISQVHQITWIPVVEYGLVFVFLFAGEGIFKVKNKLSA